MSSYVRRNSPGDTEWFVHDRFGMFIHFGLYALPARHEWVKSREFIPEGQERITSVKAEYESAYGLIKAAWCFENGEFVYRVTVPENSEATVVFPLVSKKNTVNVNGLDFADSAEFKLENGKMTFKLKSGEYVIR